MLRRLVVALALRACLVPTSLSAKAAARRNLGEYYRVDVGRTTVVDSDVDLEALGRKLGALADWERLES